MQNICNDFKQRFVDTFSVAGHCVAGKISQIGWKPITVRLGEHDLRTSPDCDGVSYNLQLLYFTSIESNVLIFLFVFQVDCADPEQDIGVSEIIVHEDYAPFSKTQYNDIALIRLSRPVQFSTFIKPVCLPIASHLRNKNYENQRLSVAGFGRTENGKPSDVKLKLNLPGFNWNRCNSAYQQQTRISLVSTQLCAGGIADEDSCSGDSGGCIFNLICPVRIDLLFFFLTKIFRFCFGLGGPLVGVDNTDVPYTYLAGVVSRGPTQCGTKDFPGVYTVFHLFITFFVVNFTFFTNQINFICFFFFCSVLINILTGFSEI